MRKRLITGSLIILLLLASCARPPAETPTPGSSEMPSPPQTSEPTQPPAKLFEEDAVPTIIPESSPAPSAGEIVPCEIPILPTSTLFRKGETLKLDISGIYRGGERVEVPFGHTDTVNKGMHSIYTGGKYDSYLLVPVVPPH